MQFHWSSQMEWPGINQSASATHQPHGICTCISCFIILGLRLDQKDCRNWSRKDRLTALESQTMTFKSFDVGEIVVRCHKSEVLSAFSPGFFCNCNFKQRNSYKVDSFLGLIFCLFELQRVTGRYLVIFAVRCWKFRGGRS